MNIQGQTHRIRSQAQWPLHTVAQTRAIEEQAQSELANHTLMHRAGLATAQLAMAIAPHAQTIWLACGSGNNGGDGLEAAIQLKALGKHPIVTWLGEPQNSPINAQQAWQRAVDAGVTFAEHPPKHFDLAIDALLGIGAQRTIEGRMAQWLLALHNTSRPVLCIDIPTGLNADTGAWLSSTHITNVNEKRHTLSLLTLKPGLFTAAGRDAAGEVWFNELGIHTTHAATVWLQQSNATHRQPPHNSHKGSFGDICILGGDHGMSGAAVLAGMAALHGGAGRVFVGLLDTAASHAVAATHPPLMVRAPNSLSMNNATVVCGCGGGDAVHAYMPHVLSSSPRLVLDADALNALARDTSLQRLLVLRKTRHPHTVLTPHPLEAARLLNCTTKDIQNHRLDAAQRLANTYQCVVVLKGSGSIIAAPQHAHVINGSGNALLATAGTGDVLAGLIGAYIARSGDTFTATCQAVWTHGQVADTWPKTGPVLDAATLAASVR
jgi:hydroxyethylthiazole kinase-like uncharacterized protein yjeF